MEELKKFIINLQLSGKIERAMLKVIEALEEKKGVLPCVKINNTDTTTNLNVGGEISFLELFGKVIEIDEGVYSVDLLEGKITVLQQGKYRFYTYADLEEVTGNNQRFSMRIFLKVNGQTVSPSYNNSYLRSSTGHEETGQGIGGFGMCLEVGDVIEIFREKDSGSTGYIKMRSNKNYIEIVKES